MKRGAKLPPGAQTPPGSNPYVEKLRRLFDDPSQRKDRRWSGDDGLEPALVKPRGGGGGLSGGAAVIADEAERPHGAR